MIARTADQLEQWPSTHPLLLGLQHKAHDAPCADSHATQQPISLFLNGHQLDRGPELIGQALTDQGMAPIGWERRSHGYG